MPLGIGAVRWITGLRFGDPAWAWVTWLMLYGWLWVNSSSGARPDVIADILNCLTSFPLFWCFFVLDKPSVAVPGDPERNASFRKAIWAPTGDELGETLSRDGVILFGDGLGPKFRNGRQCAESCLSREDSRIARGKI